MTCHDAANACSHSEKCDRLLTTGEQHSAECRMPAYSVARLDVILPSNCVDSCSTGSFCAGCGPHFVMEAYREHCFPLVARRPAPARPMRPAISLSSVTTNHAWLRIGPKRSSHHLLRTSSTVTLAPWLSMSRCVFLR